mmetsp:Transcript_29839/g.55849  ORF Transcript_29839/g.55849 Transcript_29839/m.55849 type:complete len:98 (+) Transcript_29839:103-396(+)
MLLMSKDQRNHGCESLHCQSLEPLHEKVCTPIQKKKRTNKVKSFKSSNSHHSYCIACCISLQSFSITDLPKFLISMSKYDQNEHAPRISLPLYWQTA